MNGDLSLSETLGGLRIANPDQTSSASPSPQPRETGLYHSPSISRRPFASPVRPYSQEQQQLLPSSNDGVDVRSLGFDPNSYVPSLSPQPYHPEQHTPTSFARSSSHRFNSRNSQPGSQDPQDFLHHNARPQQRTYPPPVRPVSGLYHGLSSGSNPGPSAESVYSRMRSESALSNASSSSGVRRVGSRAGVSLAQQALSNPAANGAPFRQHSNSSPVMLHPFPPRRSSNTRQHTEAMMQSPVDEPHSASLPVESPMSAQEDWQERGAAVGHKSTTDASGKPASKVVKKGVKDFAFGRTLGEGSYSNVMAATDRVTSKEYAIKILDKRHIIREKKVKYVNIEKDTLNRLTDHPGIVRLYYTFQDERSLYFVLDLASGGELLGVLKRTTTFDEECTRFYAAQILDAIEYMHSRGIIHRDLKPENVLLDDHGHVKITDFGTAKILDLSNQTAFGKVSVTNDPKDGAAETDRAASFVGTAEYVSPELLTEKNACKASDLWAFGCIVYQLLAGRPPFRGSNEYQTFQKIVNLEYTFPDAFPSLAKSLVESLLVLDPALRLPIDDIKSHSFFAGVQWGKSLWKQKAPKLRSYNPNAMSRESSRDQVVTLPQTQVIQSPHPIPASAPSNTTSNRPQPRLITQLAPPSQLDIDWSPVLTKTNERIAKLGQLVVYSTPAPHSPTSKNVPGTDQAAEQPSKFSRFFGASVTKKRQRLVMITSSARLVLAPASGDKKEAKQIINLTDPDVAWRRQQDAKGYTVWCVFTRDRHFTFEDPKANTGEAGSSTRSTQEWLDLIQEVRDYLPSQQGSADTYVNEGYAALSPSASNPNRIRDGDESPRPDTAHGHGGHSGHPHLRKTLRKEPSAEDDGAKNRKRFSRRHSKNGLAAVF